MDSYSSKVYRAHGHMSDLTDLPKSVVLKDRQTLTTDGDQWELKASADGGGTVYIDFRRLVGITTNRFLTLCKLFVTMKAIHSKPPTLVNIVKGLCRAAIFWTDDRSQVPLDWSSIGIAECQSLLSHGMKNPAIRGNDFSYVRDLYQWAAFVEEFSDFDPHVAMSLKRIRAPGNDKGVRVTTMDMRMGPFIREELDYIDEAIKRGDGSSQDLALVQLCAELGTRPIQLLCARWLGLKKYEVKAVENGEAKVLTRYTLTLPRAKERGERRGETIRPISSLLGTRLEALQPPSTMADAPLVWWLGPDASPNDVCRVLKSWAADVGLISPRTRELLHVAPYRFRYSMAVEAARDGASDLTIAELLDHSDTQHVRVYADAAGTIMDLIEGNLDVAFGAQIKRFMGKIVDESDQKPFEDVKPRIIPGFFPQLTEAPILNTGIGACGKNVETQGLCKLAPPLTCYTCPKFAAFRQAPHRQILESLEKIAISMFGGKADARMAGELVRVINALRELLRQIEQEKE